ncbi:MAG: hypothetical protein ACRDNW_28285 [Trebonia sp.]
MPELVLIEIAAALAAKATESVYELVREKFKSRRKALDALDAADGKPTDSPEVLALAQEINMAQAYDERFKEQLRSAWATVQVQAPASGGSAANTITGNVTGNVVQARDIHGDVRFGT